MKEFIIGFLIMITFLTIYTSKRPVSIPFKATSFRKFLQSGVGGLEVACWLLVPKFAGSNPTEAVGFFRAKKTSARFPSEGK